ncbi:DUF2334 domain-containing protein [Candidatus Accumulibacter phosphatis]|uniref:DUF2334 domain-containing protein n=1 Tax=Candidatus Accumulibacter contiguus TaxID=2954381 RepID=A0ABX1T9J7_9PROT|nr:DUF2334 domain-containing protein [Candidatus Accumulibacter contiguus]NMQ06352.1 DUF2334 domain-containing protein [Candidatus Accumulibacter contiguus]
MMTLIFFTDVDSFCKAYKGLESIPISVGVVPWVSGYNGDCPESSGIDSGSYYDVADNKDLVSFLSSGINTGRIEVLLHGVTHEYRFDDGRRLAEMQWRELQSTLPNKLLEARQHLQRLTNSDISWFVPPSNIIYKNGIKAVISAGMNLSGIIGLRIDRELNRQCVVNYLLRWLYRGIYGYPYPAVLEYAKHNELNACRMASYEYLKGMFDLCKKYTHPMVVNTHYWDLRDNGTKRDMLARFC